jgi:hypothetical protein
VLALVETATSYPSSKQTAQFFADFDRHYLAFESLYGGTSVAIPWSADHLYGLGIPALVLANRLPSGPYAREVDFVMLADDTVMTLSLVGGSDITLASEAHLARRALEKLQRTFGTSAHRSRSRCRRPLDGPPGLAANEEIEAERGLGGALQDRPHGNQNAGRSVS